MEKTQKITCTIADGRTVEAQAPVIISASRSTDIPAFYADWFFNRLRTGYSVWRNPFCGKSICVSYQATRFIVFWSKNPRPLLKYLDELQERNIGCYVQFTLNDYVAESFEPNVPTVEERLDTFHLLVEKLGKGGVIWRNDPLLLTEKIGVEELLKKTERLGCALKGLTEKLVFSYADITRTVAANLRRAGIAFREWTPDLMRKYAAALTKLNEQWGYELATCAEQMDLSAYGIAHNHCVDEKLIIRRGYKDGKLMKHLGVRVFDKTNSLCSLPKPWGAIDLGDGAFAVMEKSAHDKGQRTHCGCIKSKDIGEYSTCRHFCVYCYANGDKEAVERNCNAHRQSVDAESITDKVARFYYH